MDNFIPKMGAKGLYVCKEPFNLVLLPSVLYEPVSIRSLADIISDGVDPFTEYYLPRGLTKVDYDKDAAADVFIVSFRTESGVFARVPTSYITGQPDIGGVPYRTMMLAVNLAPIPDTYDLTFLQQRMRDLVFDTLGVQGTATPLIVSAPTVITQTEHDALEAARQVVIANNKTDYAKYLAAMAELTEARERITMLEQYIVDHPGPV